MSRIYSGIESKRNCLLSKCNKLKCWIPDSRITTFICASNLIDMLVHPLCHCYFLMLLRSQTENSNIYQTLIMVSRTSLNFNWEKDKTFPKEKTKRNRKKYKSHGRNSIRSPQLFTFLLFDAWNEWLFCLSTKPPYI